MCANRLRLQWPLRSLLSLDGSFEFAPDDTAYQSQDSQTTSPPQLGSIAPDAPGAFQLAEGPTAGGPSSIPSSLLQPGHVRRHVEQVPCCSRNRNPTTEAR